MASNDYKGQWIREHRNYLKSIGQYYGSTYDPSHRKVTKATEPKKDVGNSRHQSESSERLYRITFTDSTPSQVVTGVSPKQLRQQYSAYPIDKITRLRRKK